MFAYTTLPVEDLTGVGGWTLYVFGVIFFVLAIGYVGYRAYGYWKRIGPLWRVTPRPRDKYVLTALAVIVSIGATSLVAVLVWAFISLAVFEPPQFIRFENNQFVLVYRWRWLNQAVPYGSIETVRLNDRYALVRPRYTSRPLTATVMVATEDRMFEITPTSAESRDRARAIYNELERHHAQFSRRGFSIH